MKDKNKSKKKSKLVSLIIINYNGKNNTIEFLKSLRKMKYPNYEIVVADNASTDGSVEAIRKQFPHVKVFRNKENLGVTGGNNLGIMNSRGEYFVLLDNDMLVDQSNWLSELVKTAESDEKIGIVTLRRVSYHNPNIIQTTGIFRKSKISKFILRMLGSPLSFAGACLIKREVVHKIGLYDEKIFGCFEDTDFYYRAKKAGYLIVYEHKARLLHKGSSSWTGYSRMYHHYKNKLRFILKNYDPFTKTFAITVNLAYYMALILHHAIKKRVDLSRAVRDGIIWNIKNWRDYI